MYGGGQVLARVMVLDEVCRRGRTVFLSVALCAVAASGSSVASVALGGGVEEGWAGDVVQSGGGGGCSM